MIFFFLRNDISWDIVSRIADFSNIATKSHEIVSPFEEQRMILVNLLFGFLIVIGLICYILIICFYKPLANSYYFGIIFLLPLLCLVAGAGVVCCVMLSNACYSPENVITQYIDDANVRYFLFCEGSNPLGPFLEQVENESNAEIHDLKNF